MEGANNLCCSTTVVLAPRILRCYPSFLKYLGKLGYVPRSDSKGPSTGVGIGEVEDGKGLYEKMERMNNVCRRTLHTVGAHSICTGVEAVTAPHVKSSMQSRRMVASAIRIFFDTCLVLGDEEARFLDFLPDIVLHSPD